MTSIRVPAALVAAPSNPCLFCGRNEKASTGECANCGLYKCSTCDRHHYGEPRECPGRGVTIPERRT